LGNSREPLVSVILANLNKGGYIGYAIDSVLCQTYRNLELIVVDGGSRDDSVKVIESRATADSRIHLILEKRSGKSSALNRGFLESAGELIAFIDADDLYHREKLSRQVRLMQSLPDVSMCHTNGWIIDGAGESSGKVYHDDLSPFPSFGNTNPIGALVRHNFILNGSAVVRRDVFQEQKFDERLMRTDDWDFWVRMATTHRFHYLDELLYAYRVYEGNTWFLATQEERMYLFEKWALLGHIKPADREINMRRLLGLYFHLGMPNRILKQLVKDQVARHIAIDYVSKMRFRFAV